MDKKMIKGFLGVFLLILSMGFLYLTIFTFDLIFLLVAGALFATGGILLWSVSNRAREGQRRARVYS